VFELLEWWNTDSVRQQSKTPREEFSIWVIRLETGLRMKELSLYRR